MGFPCAFSEPAAPEIREAFAVGDRDRQDGPFHAPQQNRRRRKNLDRHRSRLELFGPVPHETRPVLRPGDDVLELRHHLASVAHPERERLFPRKETGEHLQQCLVEKDGPGPARTRAQDIPVRKPTAGHETHKIVQRRAAGEQVRHVHIHAREPGQVKRRRHLDMPVDPLLPQDRHPRPFLNGWALDVGCWMLDVRLLLSVCHPHRHPRIFLVQQRIVFFLRAVRVVSQSLHAEREFRPRAVKMAERFRAHLGPAVRERENTVRAHAAQDMRVVREPAVPQPFLHGVEVALLHLQDRAQFFVEQRRQRLRAQRRHVGMDARSTAQRHLHEGHENTAVGPVMIRQEQSFRHQILDGYEETYEQGRIVEVRAFPAHLPVHLAQGRTAETGPAGPEIDREKNGIRTGLQVRRHGLAHVADGRKRADHQAERRRHLLRRAPGRLPYRPHRKRILADRNGDPEGRTQRHADRLHRVVQRRVFSVLSARAHPVRRELHVPDGPDADAREVCQRLPHGHAPGRGPGNQCEHRPLPHGHALPSSRTVGRGRHGTVGDGGLERPHHLLPRNHAGHAAVRDGDEERLVRHGRQAEHALNGVGHRHAFEAGRRMLSDRPRHVPEHPGRLAQDDPEIDIDGPVPEMLVVQAQVTVTRRLPHHGHGTPFPPAQREKIVERRGFHGEHVPFLCFAAPDLHRAHRHILVRDLAKMKRAARVGHQFGTAVRQSAGPQVVDAEDGVPFSHTRAGIDHFLAPALHLRVVALDRVEIQFRHVAARGHGRRRAAAKPDPQGRSPDLQDQ